jgi:hypothetical protein
MAHSDGTTESSPSAAVNPQLIQPTLQVDAGMSFVNFRQAAAMQSHCETQ